MTTENYAENYALKHSEEIAADSSTYVHHMKPVKYLLKGWKVNDQGVFERHCEIVDTYELAEVALHCMDLRNLDSMKLKIDSIEAI